MTIPSIIDCYLTGRVSKQELSKALRLDGHDRGFIAGVIEEPSWPLSPLHPRHGPHPAGSSRPLLLPPSLPSQ